VSGGKANFDHLYRSGGVQMVYRSIPGFSGPVRITVTGQVDWWENNCQVIAGIADENIAKPEQSTGVYPGLAYGFFGGGCSVQGPIILPAGVAITFDSDGCSFTQAGAPWIKPGVAVEAILEIK
jgi:hypothetical protein